MTGSQIERITKMTNFDLLEASDRFQSILERSGITKELNRQGIELGDTVSHRRSGTDLGHPGGTGAGRIERRTARERYMDRKSRFDDMPPADSADESTGD